MTWKKIVVNNSLADGNPEGSDQMVLDGCPAKVLSSKPLFIPSTVPGHSQFKPLVVLGFIDKD